MVAESNVKARMGSMIAPSLFRNAQRKVPYSDEWYTPPEIPRALGTFDLDPCQDLRTMRNATSAARKTGWPRSG